jgi:S1 RNA binding domain protein
VLQLKDYGALVQLPNGMPALLHISELSHARVREVGDVVVEGQEVQVLVKGRDSRGQLLLSRKALLPLIPQPAGDTSQAATAEEQG